MSAFPYNIPLGCVWDSVFFGSLGSFMESFEIKKVPLKWSFCASDEINVIPGSAPFLSLIHFVSPKSSGKICSYSTLS